MYLLLANQLMFPMNLCHALCWCANFDHNIQLLSLKTDKDRSSLHLYGRSSFRMIIWHFIGFIFLILVIFFYRLI